MPIYEYQCRSCTYQFETMQRISEPALTQCPECGLDSLKKLISAVSFRLKGGGWYETDFKKGDARNLVKPESAGEQNGDASGAKDSEGSDRQAGKQTQADAQSAQGSDNKASNSSDNTSNNSSGKSDKKDAASRAGTDAGSRRTREGGSASKSAS